MEGLLELLAFLKRWVVSPEVLFGALIGTWIGPFGAVEMAKETSTLIRHLVF